MSVAKTRNAYCVRLSSTNHDLLSIPHPPLILDRLSNRQRYISTRNPTHARRANRLGEEARRHHGPFSPLVVLHEKRRSNDGPAETPGLGPRPRRRQRLLGDDLDGDMGREARPEDRRSEVRREEVAARG